VLRAKKKRFGSRASDCLAREPRPLPFRINFPKDAEEKESEDSEGPLYIRILRAKRDKLLGG